MGTRIRSLGTKVSRQNISEDIGGASSAAWYSAIADKTQRKWQTSSTATTVIPTRRKRARRGRPDGPRFERPTRVEDPAGRPWCSPAKKRAGVSPIFGDGAVPGIQRAPIVSLAIFIDEIQSLNWA